MLQTVTLQGWVRHANGKDLEGDEPEQTINFLLFEV